MGALACLIGVSCLDGGEVFILTLFCLDHRFPVVIGREGDLKFESALGLNVQFVEPPTLSCPFGGYADLT